MTEALLLDEHYSEEIAQALREQDYDVTSVVSSTELRGKSDEEIFKYAAENGRRIVTENIKDFRPFLTANPPRTPSAKLLLVPPRRFPRGGGKRQSAIVAALATWLSQSDERPQEDWLTDN